METVYRQGLLPVQLGQSGLNILDAGCGNGINTLFLANLFPTHQIEGVDKSAAQLEYARKYHWRQNIQYYLKGLEEFETDKKYHFILASHVLQHIDIPLADFLIKSLSLLHHEGEIWFVLQTRKGMNEIIAHQKPYLQNPKLQSWKTFEGFLPEFDKLLSRHE